MAQLTLQILKFSLVLIALCAITVCLALAAPVVMLWPTPPNELAWKRVIGTRFRTLFDTYSAFCVAIGTLFD
ncbi:MAG: hypothetical protein JWP89_2030 [Schlesneria sp.]|nr:hypothetical protein [Schlesneria sp.]